VIPVTLGFNNIPTVNVWRCARPVTLKLSEVVTLKLSEVNST